MKPNVFVSHASEDKDAFVRPFAEELQSLGSEVWYDEFSLKAGDSLRASIDQGLSACNFAVVVLSDDFFRKGWTNWELNGLVTRHVSSPEAIIIPIWLGIDAQTVRKYSPSIADIVAINARDGPVAAARTVHSIVSPPDAGDGDPLPDDPMKKLSIGLASLCNVMMGIVPDSRQQGQIKALLTVVHHFGEEKYLQTTTKGSSLSIKAEHGILGWVLKKAKPMFFSSDDVWSNSGYIKSDPDIKSELVIPIISDSGEVDAVVSFSSTEQDFEKLTEHNEFFKSFLTVCQLTLSPLIGDIRAFTSVEKP